MAGQFQASYDQVNACDVKGFHEELLLGNLKEYKLGARAMRTSMQHFERALQLDPDSVPAMMEVAYKVVYGDSEAGGRSTKAHQRGVKLMQRAHRLEPQNEDVVGMLAYSLSQLAHGSRTTNKTLTRRAFGALEELVRQTKQMSPMGKCVHRWQRYTAKLQGDFAGNAGEPAAGRPRRCLGRKEGWQLQAWPRRQVVLRVNLSDAAALRALSEGSGAPLLVSGGTPSLTSKRLDEALAESVDALAWVIVAHENGEAVKFEDKSELMRDPQLARRMTDMASAKPEQDSLDSRVAVKGKEELMWFGDFLALSSLPAYKPNSALRRRPPLYLINANLHAGLPKLSDMLFDGSLSREGELLQRLAERFKGAERGKLSDDIVSDKEANIWMGTDATISGLHKDMYDNWLYVVEGEKDGVRSPCHPAVC